MTQHDVLHAVSFAARAHAGQLRKDGKTPYFAHVVRVSFVLRNVFGFDDPAMLQATILHDTLEDTDTDFDDLAEAFSPQVATWVAALSKDKRLVDAEREAAYITDLLAAGWQVQVCKLADMYDNLLDSKGLDATRRESSRKRIRHYLDAFAGLTQPDVVRCRAIVEGLFAEPK